MPVFEIRRFIPGRPKHTLWDTIEAVDVNAATELFTKDGDEYGANGLFETWVYRPGDANYLIRPYEQAAIETVTVPEPVEPALDICLTPFHNWPSVTEAYSGGYDLDNLHVDERSELRGLMNRAISGAMHGVCSAKLGNEEELDLEVDDILGPLVTAVADWYVEHHMVKQFDVTMRATYTAEIHIKGVRAPDEETANRMAQDILSSLDTDVEFKDQHRQLHKDAKKIEFGDPDLYDTEVVDTTEAE